MSPFSKIAADERRLNQALTALSVAIIGLAVGLVVLLFAWFSATDRIQDGRRAATLGTCAIQTAVIEEGKEAIRGGGTLPGDRLSRNARSETVFTPGPLSTLLGKYGYPPYEERVKASRMAASRYEERIIRRAEQVAREQGVGIDLGANGTLDCRRFLSAANVTRR